MNRLVVALLACFDAAVAAAVGLACVLAPLALLWVVGMDDAGIEGLWPATAAIWQLGHLVPQMLQLPQEYLTAAGIDPAAASFTLSLAPLALGGFTIVFAARSGARAARAGAGPVGVVSGGAVFAVVTGVVWLTAQNSVVAVAGPVAVAAPVLLFVLPAAAGAVAAGWDSDDTVIDRLRAWAEERMPADASLVPELAVRGAALVITTLIGAGAALVLLALLTHGGRVVALYQAGNLDAIGVVVLSLAQLAYLPTLVVWGASFTAGPGFVLGEGSSVSPAGTHLGPVPPIPVLGALPESSSSWMLVLVLVPIAAGALAGVMLRSRMLRLGMDATAGLRAVVAAAVALASAGGAALLAVLASGSIGPDRLAAAGPPAWPFALAVGIEVFVGAAIILLGPAHDMLRADGETAGTSAAGTTAAPGAIRPDPVATPAAERHPAPPPRPPAPTPEDQDALATAPIDPGPFGDEQD